MAQSDVAKENNQTMDGEKLTAVTAIAHILSITASTFYKSSKINPKWKPKIWKRFMNSKRLKYR